MQIAYCPGVRHLHSIGREVSPFYRYATECVMAELAAMAGGREPRLSLTLPHGKAALLPLAPPDAPANAALCCLIPTGNEPFASEISRFLGAHSAEQIAPLGR